MVPQNIEQMAISAVARPIIATMWLIYAALYLVLGIIGIAVPAASVHRSIASEQMDRAAAMLRA